MRVRTEDNLEFDGERYKGDSWGQEEEIEVIRKWYGEEEKGMMFPEESLLMRAGGVRDRVLQPAAQQHSSPKAGFRRLDTLPSGQRARWGADFVFLPVHSENKSGSCSLVF